MRSAGDQLRMLHWNVHSWRDPSGGSNLAAAADQILQTKPHVVSLVEVDESWASPSALSELASKCGYSWIFPPSFEYGHDEPAGVFGNALLANLPILAVQQRQLLWPPRTYDRSEQSEPRSVVLARIDLYGLPLWTGATHLPRKDPAARAAAARRLTELAKQLDRPWIICGDFNMPASSWLNDTGLPANTSPDPAQPTYPVDRPTEPIDYCISSTDVIPQAQALTTAGSDHRPILVVSQITAP